jgi:LDH2 family malate/lactate/ureidoglycolate dehydrogenase
MAVTQTINILPASAEALATEVLIAHGVPAARAALIASALLLADLRGVDTHGINRLPGYIDRVVAQVVQPAPELTFAEKAPTMALLDAKNTFGFVAGMLAVDKCIDMAKIYGMGMVTNASRAMPPWGGAKALLGTSPFAVGVPGGEQGDFVLDMSPCVAARGKIRKAARRGEDIPEGYALDSEGRPTTDPTAALNGVVLPMGGPKGSGLAMMMDIFGGVMSGAAFAGEVNDQYKVMDKPQNVGHWFLVFRPEVFLDGGVVEFREKMDFLLKKVKGCKKADGFERIYVSGEIEAKLEEKRLQQGIPYTQAEIDTLHGLAKEAGVENRMEIV